MKIADFLKPEFVVSEIAASSKAAAIDELSRCLASHRSDVNADELRKVLETRELLASTAIGDGIAIPHGKLESVGQLVGLLGRKAEGIEFDSVDGQPTQLVFVLVAPASSTGVHLKALARISRLFREPEFRNNLLLAPDAATMYSAILEEDAKY